MWTINVVHIAQTLLIIGFDLARIDRLDSPANFPRSKPIERVENVLQKRVASQILRPNFKLLLKKSDHNIFVCLVLTDEMWIYKQT